MKILRYEISGIGWNDLLRTYSLRKGILKGVPVYVLRCENDFGFRIIKH